MSNAKSITIVKGQEYKVCKIDMKNENNFLHDSYLKANNCLKEIAEFRKHISKLRQKNLNEKKYDDTIYENINNIITFCGERGQGKTSAMISFAKILSEDYGDKYYIMRTIDPTSLEKNDNILMMTLYAIFNEFKKNWENLEFLQNSIDIDKILKCFQEVHHHITSIKCSSYTESSDFDETMENLNKYGESINLKSSFEELITEFMNYKGNKDGYFVIPIDDTDLNIERAYEIVEDIRKYLTIPNVIIFMATKIEQLEVAVEQHFRLSYKTMTDAKQISDAEISQMTSKYLNKLIPETRRINIPKIGAVDENGNLPNIIYRENSDETSNNILEEYGDNLQTQIIKFIEDKTAISFDANNLNRVHWIIPQTMRELVNLLAFLSRMDNVGKSYNEHFYFNVELDKNRTHKPVIKKLYNNLNEFYTYFRTCWMANNLNKEEIKSLERIINSDAQFTHTQTLLELKKMVSVLDDSLKNSDPDKATNISYGKKTETLEDRLNKIIESQSPSNAYGYCLGNIIDAIMAIEKCACLDNVLKFTFAVKTIYTIKMMIISEIEIMNTVKPTDFENWSDSAIIKFIGIDFIGKYNTNSLFPTIGSSNVNRGRFTIPINSFNEELNKVCKFNNNKYNITEFIETTYLKQFVFSGYSDSDYNYLQTKSRNNKAFSNLYCNISYYFIYTIMDTTRNKSNVIFNLLNIEKIFNIISEQLRVKDSLKNEATLKNMYIGFFNRFKDFSFREDIIGSLKNDNEYIVALDNALKIESQGINKNSPYFNARRRSASDRFSVVRSHIMNSIKRDENLQNNKEIIRQVSEKLNEIKSKLIYDNVLDEQKNDIYDEINYIISDILSNENE